MSTTSKQIEFAIRAMLMPNQYLNILMLQNSTPLWMDDRWKLAALLIEELAGSKDISVRTSQHSQIGSKKARFGHLRWSVDNSKWTVKEGKADKLLFFNAEFAVPAFSQWADGSIEPSFYMIIENSSHTKPEYSPAFYEVLLSVKKSRAISELDKFTEALVSLLNIMDSRSVFLKASPWWDPVTCWCVIDALTNDVARSSSPPFVVVRPEKGWAPVGATGQEIKDQILLFG